MAVIKDLLKTLSNEDQKNKAKFTLGVLQRLATTKMDEFNQEAMLLPTASFGPVRVKAEPYDFRTRMYFKVSETPNEKFKNIFDSIFNGTDPDFKKIIGDLLKTGLDVLLGNVSAGEYRQTDSFVTLDGENIIRVDSLLWNYNFNSYGLTAAAENAFAYGVCLSTVKAEEVSDHLLHQMIDHMVNKMTGLTPEQKKQKKKELWEKFRPQKEAIAAKRLKLNALTALVNEKVSDPSGIARDPKSGMLYFACPDSGQVWQAAGDTVQQLPGELKFDRPTDVACHPAGSNADYVLIAEHGGARVRLFSKGLLNTVFDGTKQAGGGAQAPVRPSKVTLNREGVTFVVAYQDGDSKPLRIITIPPGGGEVTVHKQEELKFDDTEISSEVHGIIPSGTSDVMVALSGTGVVGKKTPTVPKMTLACGRGEYHGDGEQALEVRLRYPCGLAADHENNLYIADAHDGQEPETSRVRKLSPQGVVTTVARGANIHAVEVDGPGRVLYTLSDSHDAPRRRFKAHPLPAPLPS
ncbi:hypothetical protein [Streptomyces sp. 3N207]|uniref:hypothetical protein n=1 Tax=Streptomyces sp. 3N207 TaxID=3457417 RepID=UPI003FCFD73F